MHKTIKNTVSRQNILAWAEMKLSYAINRKWWEDRGWDPPKNGLE